MFKPRILAAIMVLLAAMPTAGRADELRGTATGTRSGNPLWAVPLSFLGATRERPIFEPLRRPRQTPVAQAASVAKSPVAPKAAEPERPPLALVGAVIGKSAAVAVFLEPDSQAIVRLREGESYAGWTVSAVARREVTLRKADRTEMLALQSPDAPVGDPSAVGAPRLFVEAGTRIDRPYAPLVAHVTPKSGEPNGL